MFYIPKFETLEELLEYENNFLKKFKKSANSQAFNQMLSIKNEIEICKQEFLNKNLQSDNKEFNNILDIG